jgi:hypothetical protein
VAGCEGFDNGTVTLSCAAASAAQAIVMEITLNIFICFLFLAATAYFDSFRI